MASILCSDSQQKTQKQVAHSYAVSNMFVDPPTDRRSAQTFFLEEETKAINQFASQSLQIFRKTGELFAQNYELSADELMKQNRRNFSTEYRALEEGFKQYCLLNHKVQHTKEVIEGFSMKVHRNNLLYRMFTQWKAVAERQKRCNLLQKKAEEYRDKRLARTVLKSWHNQMVQSNRARIKRDVMISSNAQVARIQRQYQRIIVELKKKLQGKLTQLSRQQSQHRLLHNKYQQMCSRQKLK